MSGSDLDRFVRAQAGVYGTALAELRGGEKRTHWMWFVFPQILGLGHSQNARLYAIADAEEARAYLDHELLGPRLRECTAAMLAWSGERTPLQILGPIDALKFHSSMTLFDAASGDEAFNKALDCFYNGKRDRATLDALGEG
ncbi:DUF1810 domain-containing protein [Aurantiacibacter spongiae]|uniref:DUF1810 domain-containing protein n=1 Tax=Aurantiacibacter spongiae TaxID=2488860 RepID=A0A3N5CZQ1_9SPHN|nr:DUF1810 domain-containing protein [Aurantiacibacter spongiae]RPF72209.1 DUF1810 domain-containing protein [Aurantiacibacter spongiae]